ncbi:MULTISPECIES: hypothetical protein [unclassified Nodosilinea]|uniref:Uncharacterized protein n=1 Tax=Leptolyngbya subtilissima DQ-A4 TaxID=2933933 RepID=A0ABV0K398_9CYAN|nr:MULTISPECIES: hypothetical protein [unclassified Nodosilinea]MBD2109116.1 hypothetical protein [Nodosilinea sp. FACHB-13]MBD2111188.1 hypothetical protein [Nodosilinea sp. FACHB-141]
MKPVWPNVPLSRWSKRLFKSLALFITSVFLVTGLSVPGYGAAQPTALTPNTDAEAGLEVLMAQEPNTSGNATLYFETSTFTISVFPRNSQTLRMNVYNRETRQSEQLNAPVTRRDGIISSDWISYDSFGSRGGRNVVYRASGNLRNNQARLEIVEVSTSAILLSQNSTSVRDFFLPGANPNPGPNPNPGQGDLLNRTLVGFDTQNHSVRVFNDNGVTKLNVYNRVSGQPLVNGLTATAEATEIAPYRCWVNYFGGQSYGGAAARYFVRVSGDGQARLEVIAANGGVLLSEPRVNSAPLITNIPQADRPACFGSGATVPDGAGLEPFVAAVFGGDNELQRVRQVLPSGSSQGVGGLTCVINPRFEDAPQGRFISAAECSDRNDASAVVNFLRGRGLNSRLVYRNFRYR